MKIVVWNVGRPGKPKTLTINQKLTEVNADIIVLTEASNGVAPEGKYFHVGSQALETVTDGIEYSPDEIRVSVYSKFPLVNQYSVFNAQTAICQDIQTPHGLLTVYATIIGIRGGTYPTFKTELKDHLSDFNKSFTNKHACLVGDLNTTFAGRVYPSNKVRQTLAATFEKFDMVNLTQNIENCVDHVIISKDFIGNSRYTISTWNENKTLSDHIGILVDLQL